MLQTAYWLKWPKCKHPQNCGPDVSILAGPLSKAEWQRQHRQGRQRVIWIWMTDKKHLGKAYVWDQRGGLRFWGLFSTNLEKRDRGVLAYKRWTFFSIILKELFTCTLYLSLPSDCPPFVSLCASQYTKVSVPLVKVWYSCFEISRWK